MTDRKCARCSSPMGEPDAGDRCSVCQTLLCDRCMVGHQVDTDTGQCHDLSAQRETLFGTADATERSHVDPEQWEHGRANPEFDA